MSPVRWRDRSVPTDRRWWWEHLQRWKWLLIVLLVVGIGSVIGKVIDDSTDTGDTVTTPAGAEYQVRVVNAIPGDAADEESDNSEPFLAVNPQNVDEMVMSAHMLGWGGFCDPDRSAVLRSLDRGRTWGLHCAIPLTENYFAGDISLAFSGDGKTLYGGFAPGTSKSRVHLIKTVPDGSDVWPIEYLRPQNDQNLRAAHLPWTGASPDATIDIVAIGIDAAGVNNCHSGVVYWNLGAASFSPVCVSTRPSQTLSGEHWTPVVRTAIHADGTIYAATYRVHHQPDVTGGALDVVVFRHDKGASLASPFTSLRDKPEVADGDPCLARDGLAGFRVERCVPVPFEDLGGTTAGGLGQERRTWTSMALAVDPNDSKHVFVAWGDTAGTTTGMTLHVRESKDAGENWTDVVTVPRAVNPALAVSAEGRLAFSYQRLEGSGSTQRWLTEVQVVGKAKFTLATMPANDPIRCVIPYMGDYMNLVAVGNDFFGAFSTSADITPSNFPEGIALPKRNAPSPDPVVCQEPPENAEMSIDPYFFAIERTTGTSGGGSFLLRRLLK
jgi:hypothetical protein